jgi:hypothetical protein
LKHAHNFILWQWRQICFWEKIYIISLILIVIGVFWTSILGTIVLLLGISLLIAWLFKWAIWDSLLQSYKEFIKDTDVKD